ncbi:potassium channel SKOR-like [Hibiscus syriacus]|uniref:potassium channel SKOR-like n=1 Tax=Hibiscus syriacus TaxID=106335 RepID=UPI001924596B|nr:potassium channel SKOR-like [Hibiscus syriacus]
MPSNDSDFLFNAKCFKFRFVNSNTTAARISPSHKMDLRMRRGGEESEDEERFEEEEESTRRPLWKRALSLLKNESSSSWSGVGRDMVSGSTEPSRSHGFIIHPDDWWYVVWTHFILIWAVYSSFFTPLEFGFFRGLPENLFLLDIAGQLAFLLDIIIRFFLAYRHTHSYRLVSDRRLIALRYLKSRFIVDFLGCLPWDAIYKVCGRKEGIRYMLWIRLSRALRVTEFFEKMEKDIRINYLFIRIVKLLVVEYYCTHAAGCIFYYLATTLPPSKEGYTWIGSLQMGEYRYSNFREIDLWKRYILSLYFSVVTMVTVGYGDIHAVNVREMIFVMIYVSFDMILGAYLIGNMAALIVKGSKTERFRDKMADLIKYMNRNNLDKQIRREVRGHLKLAYDRSYTEATALQDVPASIRTKISQKLYEPFIKQIFLFKGCSTGFIKQIAIKVHEEFFLPGEVIIEQGNVVDQLYIVCHGKLVEVGRGKNDETGNSFMDLQTYSSFGEVSFLCNTPQPYTIRVGELSRVLRLDKRSFMEMIEIYFCDGRIILNNLLEGKDANMQNEILESDVTLYIGKLESELAARLNCAAYNGDLYRLKRLIGAGADPNRTDYDGRSPLHIAASRGYEDITGFLIEQKVEINISDKFGNTPLLEATKHGHDRVTCLLVQAGALLAMDDEGCFLCMTVARRDLDLLNRVLAAGINPNAKSYDCRTPLHVAASEGLYFMAKSLVEAGASVFSKDRWGNTPIDEARIGGNTNLIGLLEAARTSQMAEFLDCPQQIRGEMWKKKCTVFPFDPRHEKGEKRRGVVLWVPQSMDELIKEAKEHFECDNDGYWCILSQDAAQILDTNMISNDQMLYLVYEPIPI